MNSQDIIEFKNGNRLPVKILEIRPNELIYKKFSNLEGPQIVVDKSEIFSVLFENGVKENYSNESIEEIDSMKLNAFAENHVKIYYKSYRSGFAKTIISSILLTPLGGYFVKKYNTNKIINSEEIPYLLKNLTSYGIEYVKNPNYENLNYKQLYIEKAKKTRAKKIKVAYILGSSIFTIIVAEISLIILNS
ncbi:MAG: hypothetical protein HYU67_09840 [Flavobacteriia bacterium]|nr:hypothetical protein [Flavobacteriia bacterium]